MLPHVVQRLPFIYAVSHPTAQAFYPPPHEPRLCCIAAQAFVDSDGPSSLGTVYLNLQPPAGTARRSPAAWWSLTPPSHPCHSKNSSIFQEKEWRSFSSTLTYRRRQLLFSEVGCPVLPGLSSRATMGRQRQAGTLSFCGCKGTNKWDNRKIINDNLMFFLTAHRTLEAAERSGE